MNVLQSPNISRRSTRQLGTIDRRVRVIFHRRTAGHLPPATATTRPPIHRRFLSPTRKPRSSPAGRSADRPWRGSHLSLTNDCRPQQLPSKGSRRQPAVEMPDQANRSDPVPGDSLNPWVRTHRTHSADQTHTDTPTPPVPAPPDPPPMRCDLVPNRMWSRPALARTCAQRQPEPTGANLVPNQIAARYAPRRAARRRRTRAFITTTKARARHPPLCTGTGPTPSVPAALTGDAVNAR